MKLLSFSTEVFQFCVWFSSLLVAEAGAAPGDPVELADRAAAAAERWADRLRQQAERGEEQLEERSYETGGRTEKIPAQTTFWRLRMSLGALI